MYAGHLDLNVRLAWTVDAALPEELCAAYVDKLRLPAYGTVPATLSGRALVGANPRLCLLR